MPPKSHSFRHRCAILADNPVSRREGDNVGDLTQRPGHLLIVDDEQIQRLLLRRAVEVAGWTTDTASNLSEAVQFIESRDYDAVVLDLSLGEQEGVSLLRHFGTRRADPIVIFVSGMDSRVRAASARLATALGLRVAGTLRKPVAPAALREMLVNAPARLPKVTAETIGVTQSELEDALRMGEIVAEFQPKVDLQTGWVVGAEALARWRRPAAPGRAAQDIPPDAFIPLAEKLGLIDELTSKILNDSLTACARWRHRHPDCGVAINVSPLTLANPALPEEIDAALRAAELPPGALTVEVTESTVIANPVVATEVLTRLRIKGIRVSIDDFGTGHSSLLSLLRLPFTELKIDRSFVAFCETDPEAWKIIRATISLGRELGLSMVAEGIEFAKIAHMLRDVGCDIGQGWHFGRSMSSRALEHWLNTRESIDVPANNYVPA